MRVSIRRHAVRYILATSIVLCVVGGVAFTLLHLKENVSNDSVSTYVPDFSFPDASGKAVVLSDLKAQVRVVNFWASWSPYSKDELPALVALKREFGDDVAVVALNRDTNPADGRAFLASLGLGSELLFAYDRDDTYFRQVGGFNMPETIFVGEEGEVLHHVHGPMTLEEMRAQVTRILDGN